MSRAFRLLGLLLVLLAASPGVRPAIAQSAAEVVDPSECTTVPLTRTDLVDRVESAPPDGLDAPQTDEPVSETVIAEITVTIRQSVACTNANKILSALALFTDRYLSERFGGEENDDLGHLLAAISREPDVAAEGDRLALISVSEPAMHADGSVAVTVTTANATATFVDRLRLLRIGGVWLIDRVAAMDEIAATPVP